ncbi:MAG: translocation/assembly module TamB domain-containing protein [Candidatus Omnitrophota bacterium]
MNARLITPQADNIVINATLRGGRYEANAYSKSLDLEWVTSIIRRFNNLSLLHGDLRDIDLVLSGRAFEPAVKGVFEVARIPLNGFLLYDAPVMCDLSFKRRGMMWETYGKLSVHRGWLKSPRSLVALGESHLIFSGNILDPELDIHAVSEIAGTRIDIVVRGKRKEPKIILTSEPPLSQEQLLLMLTTGKRWDGIDMAMTTKKMTPELAGDFVDYFFFGGSGDRIARIFGFSRVSYKLDSAVQGVTFNKDLTDRLDVGYGIEIGAQGDQGQRELTQKVESEYRINSHVIIAAQKEILSSSSLDREMELRRIPDDRIFLKYRKQF